MPRLDHLDQATGLPLRRPPARRYEKTRPGELVHVDIKKLGRIRDGGGHRLWGRAHAKDHTRRGKRALGYAYLHHAIDDYSRLACSEILSDEKQDTAAQFWTRARAFFTAAGIQVKAVMTDKGACYRSRAFNQALGENVKHRYTRPYHPKPTGR